MEKIRKLYLFIRALPKTLYFNFHYFSFKQAIRLPVLISHRVILHKTRGKVIAQSYRTGAIRIGFNQHIFFSDHKLNSTWSVDEEGSVIFNGTAFISNGTRFFVRGKLTFGDNMIISANTKIQCFEEITFGKDVGIGWDCVFMDTDGHSILDEQQNVVNPNKPIIIGDDVWVGAKSFISKGVTLASHMVVAANSIVLKSFDLPNHIIGGYPAKVIKCNITIRR